MPMDSPPLKVWPSVFREVYRGTSVGRALMHLRVKSDVAIRGNVIDIGGGRRQTYLRYVDDSESTEIKAIDVEPGPMVDVVASVTDMPLATDSVDTVLCFNVLEHVFDHRGALKEIQRVMKSDATLYGWVPFLIGVHGAPDDYFRYTASALHNLLSDSGFQHVHVEYCGNVFLSAFDLLRPYIRGWVLGRLIRVGGLALALLSYQVYRGIRRLGKHPPLTFDPCPLGLWFIARPSRER